MFNADITAKLVSHFEEQAERQIRGQFEMLVNTFGAAMQGVSNSRYYSVWAETVRHCVTANFADQFSKICGRVQSYELDDAKVVAMSKQFAEEATAELVSKINEKVGELENGSVAYVSGANFLITGTKAGKSVAVHQNQIINVSVKGKLFNQFPARIYVDNKFTSAAAFAKL